jgi:hypothetical protein
VEATGQVTERDAYAVATRKRPSPATTEVGVADGFEDCKRDARVLGSHVSAPHRQTKCGLAGRLR